MAATPLPAGGDRPSSDPVKTCDASGMIAMAEGQSRVLYQSAEFVGLDADEVIGS